MTRHIDRMIYNALQR